MRSLGRRLPAAAAAAAAACLGGTEPIYVADVVVLPDGVELTAIGQTQQYAAVVLDPVGDTIHGVTVSWSTWDSSVVTIDQNGLATAAGLGHTRVFAEAGPVLGNAQVTVAQRVDVVAVEPAAVTLALGDTLRFAAVARDANGNLVSGRAVVWASSDSAVLQVDGSGLARATAGGVATLTATVGEGAGEAAVTVPWPAWLDLAWSTQSLATLTSADLIAVAALDSSRIVVGGSSGSTVIERENGTWSARSVPCTGNAIGDFWVDAARNAVFAVGRGYWERCILERRDGTWRRFDGDSVFNVNAISGVDSATIYIAGTWGLLERVGSRWQLVRSGNPDIPTLPWYEDVLALSAGDVWAVGLYGLVVHFDGTGWDLIGFPDGRNLEAVWRGATGAVWADNARWTGAGWAEAVRLPRGVRDASALAGEVTYVASADTLFASADGDRWWVVPGAPSARRVWVTGEGVVLALTGEDAVLHIGRRR